MISRKLKILSILSILIILIHWIEEYATKFSLYNLNSFAKFFYQYFDNVSTSEAIFITTQALLWIFLIVAFLLKLPYKLTKWIIYILSLILIFELHHILYSLVLWKYYPGLITGLLFPILCYFYFKELIHIPKHKRHVSRQI